jgi:hypothetical protein
MMWSEMMEKINSLETSRIGSVKSGDIYIYIYITTGLGRRK